MKIETHLQDDHQINIIVELEQDLLERHKHKAVRAISKQAKIPGFRPGKAPYSVLLRHFGEEVILEEALESLVNEAYPQIIEETAIKPYGPGALKEIISKEPPKLSFTVPLMPEVELFDYHTVRKEYQFDQATDEEVNQVLMNLQVQQAVTEAVEGRPVQSGDLVQLKMNEIVKNPNEGQEAKIVDDMAQSVYVNKDYDHKDSVPYQGFMDELLGMNIGEEKTLVHTFAEIDEDDELYGKEVEIHFTLEGINTAQLPEINDEFAQTVNTEFATVDDLRKSISDQIESYRKQQYENDYLTSVMGEIVSNSSVKYPPQLFEAEADAYLEHIIQDLKQQGIEFETYLKVMGKSKEQLLEEQKADIDTKIHRALVLEEIARKEELKVEAAELQASVSETAMRYGLYNYMKSLPKQQADELAHRLTMDAANQILNVKLSRRLIDIASGSFQEVSLSETPQIDSPEGTTEEVSEE